MKDMEKHAAEDQSEIPSHSGRPGRECVVPDTGKNMEECKDQLPKEDPDKIREDIAKLI